MARVAQGGTNPGQQLVGGRWQHPNATPPSEQGNTVVPDKSISHVAGGGPKVDTTPAEPEVEPKRVRKVRTDLNKGDRKKYRGSALGKRAMRRRNNSGKYAKKQGVTDGKES